MVDDKISPIINPCSLVSDSQGKYSRFYINKITENNLW